MLKEGKISSKQVKDIIKISLEEDKNPIEIIKELNITQITDPEEINKIINEVLEENSNILNDYKAGKNVTGYIIGLVMKKSNGKVNPKLANTCLNEIIKKLS